MSNLHWCLANITKNNCCFELQCFLEQYDLIYILTRTIHESTKQSCQKFHKQTKTSMYEIKTNLGFIGVFDFLSCKPTSMQSLLHSYWHVIYYFGQVMHLCKYARVDFIKTYLKPLQTQRAQT